jgi:hypothetical protein
MNYYVSRNGQQFGPYSLADLQRYLASGEILATDLARSEALSEWVPVTRIVGTVPVASGGAVSSYGQIPAYAAAGVSDAAASQVPALAPNLPWWVLLLLSVVTCGIFTCVWMIVQAIAVQRLDPKSKAVIYYGAAIGLFFINGFLDAQPAIRTINALIRLAGIVIIVAGHFSIKGSLEEYFNRTEPIRLQLSGVMTFFFNTFYFQYHFNRIQRWRETGVLS